MLADIANGNFGLADWLLLIAFVVFVIDVVLVWLSSKPARLNLIALGLALISMALMQW